MLLKNTETGQGRELFLLFEPLEERAVRKLVSGLKRWNYDDHREQHRDAPAGGCEGLVHNQHHTPCRHGAQGMLRFARDIQKGYSRGRAS